MKNRIVVALLALGLCAGLHASVSNDHARITFVKPGISTEGVILPTLKLVVEGPFISYEKTAVPEDVVGYVDKLLSANGAAQIAIYVREGARYGDVVRALDLLRKTAAKNIGVSMIELAAGREV